MFRYIATGLVLLIAAACVDPPHEAPAADVLGQIRASLQLREKDGAQQVVLYTEIPKALRKRLKRKFGKLKLVVVGGRDPSSLEGIAVHKMKLRRKVRTWTFDLQELCKRGLRHLRFDITPTVKTGHQHADNVSTLELSCPPGPTPT